MEYGGIVYAVDIINPGTGYGPSVAGISIVSTLNPSLPYPLGAGFQGSVVTNDSGVITGVIVMNGGAGYTNILPQLVITDPGIGATTQVNLTGTVVSSVTVLTSGDNYDQSATGVINNPPTASSPITESTVTINTPINTYDTDPNLYYQVWAGTATNGCIQAQIQFVLDYFINLGYTVQIMTNPQTGTTFVWCICW